MKSLAVAKEIINRMDKPTSQQQVVEVLRLYREIMLESIHAGRPFSLAGIGSFRVKKMKPRKGYDVIRKKHLKIPAQYVVRFKSSKTLHDALNV